MNGYRRFVICSNPYKPLEVEPALLHSSIYDDCTEIYAETDFPFTETERVERIVKEISIPKPKLKSETINPEDE